MEKCCKCGNEEFETIETKEFIVFLCRLCQAKWGKCNNFKSSS